MDSQVTHFCSIRTPQNSIPKGFFYVSMVDPKGKLVSSTGDYTGPVQGRMLDEQGRNIPFTGHLENSSITFLVHLSERPDVLYVGQRVEYGFDGAFHRDPQPRRIDGRFFLEPYLGNTMSLSDAAAGIRGNRSGSFQTE